MPIIFFSISDDKRVCRRFKFGYRGSEPLAELFNVTFGIHEFVGTRKDCKNNCSGIFMLKTVDKVSLVHIFGEEEDDILEGWGGTVISSCLYYGMIK